MIINKNTRNFIPKGDINLLEQILELIFPTTCGMCGKIYKEPICNKCMGKINKEMICKKQYKYMSGEFVQFTYLFKYKNELRKILLSYKFKEKNYLYEFFVKIILKNEKVYKFFLNYDIIIPVPLYYKKLKQRGYNQCGLISKEIAKNVKNLKYEDDILIKIKNNLRQSSLNSNERKNNVKGAYKINDFENQQLQIKGKKILIFDDIYTTGNTVKECTNILKQLEPSSIGVITIFKD